MIGSRINGEASGGDIVRLFGCVVNVQSGRGREGGGDISESQRSWGSLGGYYT